MERQDNLIFESLTNIIEMVSKDRFFLTDEGRARVCDHLTQQGITSENATNIAWGIQSAVFELSSKLAGYVEGDLSAGCESCGTSLYGN